PQSAHHRYLHSFPTRRSSDLEVLPAQVAIVDAQGTIVWVNQAWSEFTSKHEEESSAFQVGGEFLAAAQSLTSTEGTSESQLLGGDRKSTRLNSSHSQISYAVF